MFYSKKKDQIFNFILGLYLFYYSYRYIFKYNSSTTSPTYRDTPVAFQLGKYVILILLIVILVFHTRWNSGSRKNQRTGNTIIATVFLIVQFTVLGVFSKEIDAIAFALVLIPPVLFMVDGKPINPDRIEKLLFAFWWFSMIYELIQVFLYVKTGRLPALAYPTGKITDVRFGGAWDDPNGYSLLMFFYLFYFLFRYKGIKQIAYLGATLMMLVLTWSGTAFIALLGTVLVVLVIRLRDIMLLKKYLYYGLLAVILAGTVLMMRSGNIMETLGYYLQNKSESISQHQSGWELSEFNILTILGIKPDYKLTEAGYIRLISIGGIPSLIAFFVIANIGCKRIKIYLKNQSAGKPILYGMLAYLIGFILFNINLPHVTSFYCMGIFGCFIVLSHSIGKDPSFQKINISITVNNINKENGL